MKAKRRRDRRRAAVDDVHLEEMRRMDAVITTKFDEILTRVYVFSSISFL